MQPEQAQTILKTRNFIEMLSKHSLVNQADRELSQILENEKLSQNKKLQLLKMQQFSENYLDKYVKAGSSSPSMGSGGGSSDEKD